eukprot:gene1865-2202_t
MTKKKVKKKLPEPLETQKNYVLCGPVVNTHTQTGTSASMYMPMGIDNSWDFDLWSGNFEIKDPSADSTAAVGKHTVYGPVNLMWQWQW